MTSFKRLLTCGESTALLGDLFILIFYKCNHNFCCLQFNVRLLWYGGCVSRILAATPSGPFVGNFQLVSLWPKHLMYICHKLLVTRLLRSTSSSPSSSVSVSDSPSDIQDSFFLGRPRGNSDNTSRFLVSRSKTATDRTAWPSRRQPLRPSCLRGSPRTASANTLLW
ncbi:uncharacterized protein LOC119365901 [Triticum dicoccoides]|uniref:uncharacterized protein LOC119365901 n=1 Tax=Triticum dicoccoides TaxID=85692 RepID=UPI00188E054D|nr:uncharacterized protein LOC119365901 [Triticum dicoccoides]